MSHNWLTTDLGANPTDCLQFVVFISSIVAGAFELYNALTVAFIIILERRRTRAKADLPKSRDYKKLDPRTEQEDEIPMLAVSRKSVQ